MSEVVAVALHDHTQPAVDFALGRTMARGRQFGGLRLGLNWRRFLLRPKRSGHALRSSSSALQGRTLRNTPTEESIFDQTPAG
jgi:hypothetical protein